jgi:uncharacterized protein YkwD
VLAARITRNLITAALTLTFLVVPATAQAADAHTKDVKATVALGDKRPARAHLAGADCANTDLAPTARNLDLVRAAVLCLHNKIRAQKGLPLLKENAKLRKAAVAHSSEMVSEGYFDHTTPSGTTFVDRVLGAGYARRTDGWTLGENLAWGTGDLSTPSGVMDAWMNSAGHKANILKRAYREVGIGVRLGVPNDDGVGATFTADFGAKS